MRRTEEHVCVGGEFLGDPKSFLTVASLQKTPVVNSSKSMVAVGRALFWTQRDAKRSRSVSGSLLPSLQNASFVCVSCESEWSLLPSLAFPHLLANKSGERSSLNVLLLGFV